jgi:hypothetical protein
MGDGPALSDEKGRRGLERDLPDVDLDAINVSLRLLPPAHCR